MLHVFVSDSGVKRRVETLAYAEKNNKRSQTTALFHLSIMPMFEMPMLLSCEIS